jgi:molybdenum cofactor synthesis domain-containing protein
VYARPRVGVMSTGNEIVPPEQSPMARRSGIPTRSCSSRSFDASAATSADLGIIRDESDAVRAALAAGIENHDALFVTGGMSMGAYDFVPRTLVELGVELKITKLRIKPGKPFVFGVRDERIVFGLRGTPSPRSSARCGWPRGWSRGCGGSRCGSVGSTHRYPSRCPPTARASFTSRFFCGGGAAQPLKWKGSADVFTLAAANGLLVRAENAPAVGGGQRVRVLEV